MKPGRNDPCPCGSGKKYKHCCLAAEKLRAETPEHLAWTRVRRAIDALPDMLAKFAAEVYGLDAIEAAWADFTGWDDSEFDPESPLARAFMPWFYHAWRPDPFEEEYEFDEFLQDRTPTSVFLERYGRRLEPLAQRYLEACLAAPYSFHEILRCDAGRGFRTRDVMTGEELEVLENMATASMRAGDILFAQLVPIDGIVVIETCSPYALPPEDKIPIIELREQIALEPLAEQDSRSRLHDWSYEIRELFLDLIDRYLEPRPPVLHNTDGELLSLQRVIFDVDDAERALDALTRVPGMTGVEVEREAGGQLERAHLSWTKPGNRAGMENTVIAHLDIAAGCVVGQVNSDGRARAFSDMVEQALGSEARFRDREVVDPEELQAELEGIDDELLEEDVDAELDAFDAQLEDLGSEDARGGERLADDPEAREHVKRFIEEYYDDWVTQELPALGGKRPIDLVHEPNGREKVEALVAGIERTAAHVNPEAGPAVVARLRERLGLVPR